MNGTKSRPRAGEARFEAYLGEIAAVLGHAGRAAPMRAYCRGLLLPGERKNIELIAARLGSDRVRSLHQSMHHVVTKAGWDDAAVLAEVRRQVLPSVERNGPVRYFTVNDIVCMKQGIHSVGVAKQLHDSANAEENCQIAVSLWASNELASLPIAYQLFLPPAWADDPPRREVAGVPPAVRFESRAAIALRQLRQACSDGMRRSVVLAAAGYGDEAGFRLELEVLGLRYVLAVSPTTYVWPSGALLKSVTMLAPGSGPVSAKELMLSLPTRAWRVITLRAGGRTGFSSRFAAIRVRLRPANSGRQAGSDRWLLAEWRADKGEPTEFWLSDLPSHASLKSLVWTAKSVWRIVSDCQELKQSIGLGHFEGRGWRGHHHHASLCIAAYGFRVAERCSFPAAQRYIPSQAKMSERLLGFQARGSK